MFDNLARNGRSRVTCIGNFDGALTLKNSANLKVADNSSSGVASRWVAPAKEPDPKLWRESWAHSGGAILSAEKWPVPVRLRRLSLHSSYESNFSIMCIEVRVVCLRRVRFRYGWLFGQLGLFRVCSEGFIIFIFKRTVK